jgi:D-alanyl-D-alanine carboxypeptidase
MRHKRLLTAILLVLLIVVGSTLFFAVHVAAPKLSQQKTTTPATHKTAAAFDMSRYSTTDPSSPWVIVNKPHPLSPINYKPADLVTPKVPLRVPGNESMEVSQVTATALERMFTDASKAGVKLMLSSGYRSYDYQTGLYNGYVSKSGQAAADTYSARPGHSEHQTGYAADVEPANTKCELEQCFGDTPEGKWLAANAYTYGFIIRYTAADQPVTGYEAEPWHIRFIGTDLAVEMHRQGITTLEQFFSVSGGPTYNE